MQAINHSKGKEIKMPYVTAGNEKGANINIYYKDWGKGQPIVFSHGWPLSADDWDPQMLFFLSKGYRVIAHDRRGHGRSTQVADGHDLDHYADDLKAVTDHLNLKDAIHVGHSTGGGEVVRYLARHGDKNVAKAAIISPSRTWRTRPAVFWAAKGRLSRAAAASGTASDLALALWGRVAFDVLETAGDTTLLESLLVA
jgi:pimeloyl-ACP methyl ester carboxylesterase